MAWGPPTTRAAHERVTETAPTRPHPDRNVARTAGFTALGALLAYLTWRLFPTR
jgi:hypothetical protein